MVEFTDELIKDYSPIRQNYVEFKDQLTGRLLQWFANGMSYFQGTKPYPGKLSESEWNATLALLKEAGPNVKFDKEAEIIYNNPKSFVLWLRFKDINGNEHKIDILLPKVAKGNSIGQRKIDSRCPLVDDIRTEFSRGYCPPEKLWLIKDIADAQPDKDGINTVEKKVQFKVNGSLVEDAIKQATEELHIRMDTLDEYSDYYYRGSPGNLADFDIYLNAGCVRFDAKLAKTDLTESSKFDVHDGQYLVAYSLATRDFIIEKKAECDVNLATDPQFADVLYRAREILRKTKFIIVDKINYEAGTIERHFIS